WVPVQMVERGKAESPDLVKNIRLRISGDNLTWSGGGLSDRKWATFSIDPSKTPKHLEWEWTAFDAPAFGKRVGIYESSDKQLKICLAPPGGARPTTFTSTAVNRQYLMVLERASGAPGKPLVWKEYTPRSNAFTVKMPGEVTVTTQDFLN